MKRSKWLLIGAAFAGTAAHGYEIRVHKIFQLKRDVHESMTAVAEDCLRRAAGDQPSRCWRSSKELAARSKSNRGERYSDIQKASRWSDDPTRQDRRLSFLKIGYNIVKGCPKWVDASRRIEDAGLLCSSHFGRLQFLHAQAVDEDKSAADTYRRIMDWADFAFRVARDTRLDDGRRLLDMNYCSAVDLEPESLKQMMRCETGGYSEWTVSTFFALTCGNPLSSSTCPEPGDPDKGRRMARLAARGSLLHLVQDSFSQSHASRRIGSPLPHSGEPHGFEPRVVCSYPTAYFNYKAQERDAPGGHKAADAPPRRDDSCDDDPRTAAPADPQTDDVVTASAMVLWHLEHGTRESFRQYLISRVFGPVPAA
ncbi:MAG TPA: hypothetical protein VD846_04490 [Allosphingosinicella sp.]|nr:hypothetical protein [Allosphingosinicella sp.]